MTVLMGRTTKSEDETDYSVHDGIQWHPSNRSSKQCWNESGIAQVKRGLIRFAISSGCKHVNHSA